MRALIEAVELMRELWQPGATVTLATEQPFTTFILWPEEASESQIRRFGEEVVPAVIASLGGTMAAVGN